MASIAGPLNGFNAASTRFQRYARRHGMAEITIKDLHTNLVLDSNAMSSIRGGGAPWVYGWIRSYVPAESSFGTSVNFYQINNNYYADQMINQVQVVDVNNSAANTNITVGLDERSTNIKH